MKVLLDESLPRKLKNDFGIEHEVWTVQDKGWSGIKNGVLLGLMESDGFEIFITVDQNLSYQQNLQECSVLIFVLYAKDNRRETLAALIPKIFDRISEELTGIVQEIR